MREIINGDCLEIMRGMPDNHISAIVTDPPYGLSFMGKQWDGETPGIEYWQEALRICKPGAHLLAFGGSRTHHHLMMAIERAGWEIRDCIMWIYGSGFPKSHNFGKKMGGDWQGYGTALKPAYEPIIMAMKSCECTFSQNAEKWGVAGINVGASRIGTDDTRQSASKDLLGLMNDDGWKCKKMTVGSECGRWPANILFDEEAAQALDEMSGERKVGSIKASEKLASHGNCYGLRKLGNVNDFEASKGGASRFFYCAKASSAERNEGLESFPSYEKETLNDYVNPSQGRIASKSGSPMQNFHPTVKPLKLMTYLIKLIMPPKDGILLDPFAGSGTTILAAEHLGVNAIGIEKCFEYAEIARARVSHEKKAKDYQLELFA